MCITELTPAPSSSLLVKTVFSFPSNYAFTFLLKLLFVFLVLWCFNFMIFAHLNQFYRKLCGNVYWDRHDRYLDQQKKKKTTLLAHLSKQN